MTDGWTRVRLGFQRGRAKGLSARYHFTFTAERPIEVTVHIHEQRLAVELGHSAQADVTLQVASEVWLRVVNREQAFHDALARGLVQVTGPMATLDALRACFPNLQ